MADIKLRHGDRVVVCDGRKALILQNQGDAERVDLRLQEKRERDDAPTAAIGTDQPGRVHSSVGSARSAVEQTDWHERDEQNFLKDLVQELNASVEQQHKTRIVIVAPPRALAALRSAYSPQLQKVIVGEIGKDLVRSPMDQIEALFGQGAH